MHILHKWGEWEYAGEVFGVPKDVAGVIFAGESLVKTGEYFEVGCKVCPKIKGRVIYDTRS